MRRPFLELSLSSICGGGALGMMGREVIGEEVILGMNERGGGEVMIKRRVMQIDLKA